MFACVYTLQGIEEGIVKVFYETANDIADLPFGVTGHDEIFSKYEISGDTVLLIRKVRICQSSLGTGQVRIWLVTFPPNHFLNVYQKTACILFSIWIVSSMYIIFFSLNLTSNLRWEAGQWRQISFILSDFMRWNSWPSTTEW